MRNHTPLGSAAVHRVWPVPGSPESFIPPGLHPTPIEVVSAGTWTTTCVVDASAVLRIAELWTFEPSERSAAVVACARDYGLLAAPAEFVAESPNGDGEPVLVVGEPLDRWLELSRALWIVVGYLYALAKIDVEDIGMWRTERLLLLIAGLRRGAPRTVPPAPEATLSARGEDVIQAWLADCRARAFVPADYQIARRVARELERDREAADDATLDYAVASHPAPPLASASERSDALVSELREQINRALRERPAELRPVVQGEAWPMRCTIEPQVLRAALWLQVVALVESVGEDSPVLYRRCRAPGCGRPMAVTGNRETGVRADAERCSPACTQRALRQRQRVARELRSDGVTLAEIVRRLAVVAHKGRPAEDIVRGWCRESQLTLAERRAAG